MVRDREQRSLVADQGEFQATSCQLNQQMALASSHPTVTNKKLALLPYTAICHCLYIDIHYQRSYIVDLNKGIQN